MVRYPDGKPCACGCGQPSVKVTSRGKIKGWRKYAKGHRPPSFIIYPEGKPCACGCGQAAASIVSKKDGKKKGWRKYAKGHRPPGPFHDAEFRKKAEAINYARLPLGSRRVHVNSKTKSYWEIKVNPATPGSRGGWMLEHRYIVQNRIGRDLLRKEHVHHRDGNGLNNGLNTDGESNLELLDQSEHMKLTSLETKHLITKCECKTCGRKHYKKLAKRSIKITQYKPTTERCHCSECDYIHVKKLTQSVSS